MRSKDESKKTEILKYINEYYNDYRETPTVRDIAAGTGIPFATVHRYLTAMQEDGELEYNGRKSVTTKRMNMESEQTHMAVLGYVACGEGQEETEEILEYIRLPESFVGKGEFFALIAKGNSMIDAGIHPGDYVIIRKQSTADIGDYIVALDNGVNNLKELAQNDDGKYFLRSCNEDKKSYPDIKINDLQVQGVAVGVMHKFKNAR